MPGNRSWCFTLNNYSEAEERNIQDAEAKYLIYGREVGDNQTPHLQGYVQFSNGKSLSAAKAAIGDRAHMEVARGTPEQNIAYCSKNGDVFTKGERPCQGKRSDLKHAIDDIHDGMRSRKRLRAEHPFVMAKYPTFIEQVLNDTAPLPPKPNIVLRDWQLQLLQMMREPPHPRKVFFVIDLQGGKGKSTFCNYVEHEFENVQVMKPGKYADMAYELSDESRIILIDCPRATYEFPVQFAEDCKDGRVTSSKYFSHQKRLSPCHVIFFVNEAMDYIRLSEDRIVRICI